MTIVKLLLLLLQAFWPWLYVTQVLVPVPVWFFQEIFEGNKEKYYEEAAESKEDR